MADPVTPEGPFLVSEIYKTIQGESSLVGYPTVFVRLYTCNLRCVWCDSMHAVEGGASEEMSVADVADRVLALALVRLVEIVGEAATRISAQFRSQHPQIPWQATIGLRNRLIHGYDSINHDILWQILTTDFPPLVVTLERIVGSE